MSALIADAVALFRLGRAQEAEQACAAILARSGNQIDARGLLAQIYTSRGQFGQAVEQLLRIAELRPRDAAAHRRLGDALFAAGLNARAAETFRRAIELEPTHPRSYNNLGRALARLGERDAAIDSYRQALALDPDYSLAHNNLGIELGESNRHDEALACYERALGINPQFAQAHGNRGNALLRLNRAEEALRSYERALALEPRNATAHCNCGNAFLQLHLVDKALASYETALRLWPDFPDGLNSRGNALREAKRMSEALASYDRAIALQPDHLEALSNRANILLELERFDEAIDCCDRILRLRPDFPRALLYRGISLNFLGQLRYDEALRCFQRLWDADPAEPYALGFLLYASAMTCDWSRAALIPEGMRSIAAGKPVISPLTLLALVDSAQAQLQCARNCIAHSHLPQAPIFTGEPRKHGKIRVAYLSPDLRDHALSYLMAGVFEKHDREKFEIFGVSFQQPVNNAFGARVLSSLDVFMDVREQTDEQAARMLNEMQIDVAVDLTGFTRGQRLNIFAHRPAPVQVSYLGFPGTSGAPYIDYLLADRFVVPPESRGHYSEQVVYLPDCFQANDDRRAIAPQRPTRTEAGLPEEGFVFCCFNSGYKITPQIFDIWCRLLAAWPASVLWMVAESEAARRNLAREASMRGIDPQRIVFAGREPYEPHLARMQLADLFLDTLPFNAGTTASDALWAGLPVLTCAGDAFAARMAGSLLHAVGLPELVTESLEAYEQLALELAASPATLAALRERLARNRDTHPLFDTARFCRHLESAYQTMYERHQAGESPVSFSVEPQSTADSRRSAHHDDQIPLRVRDT